MLKVKPFWAEQPQFLFIEAIEFYVKKASECNFVSITEYFYKLNAILIDNFCLKIFLVFFCQIDR